MHDSNHQNPDVERSAVPNQRSGVTPTDPPELLRSQHLTRTAILLGILTVLGSCLVGYFAYIWSRNIVLEGTYNHNLNLARTLAEYAGRSSQSATSREVYAELQVLWERTKMQYSGSYMCAVRANGELALHTAQPDQVGMNVGDIPLVSRRNGDPKNLRELASAKQDWVGEATSLTGQQQVIAFSYANGLDALVALHTPRSAISGEIHAKALPWGIGIAVITVVLLPLSLWLLHRAYAHAQRTVNRALIDRQSNTAALQENEARTRAIVNTAVDGIITINESGIIESFNPAAEEIFGYRTTEIIGKNVVILMPEPYHSEHADYINNYLRTGEKKIIGLGREVAGRRKDGTTFPIELAISEIELPEQRLFCGIVRDITERKEAERHLREAYEELRQTRQAVMQQERLRALGQMASGIAHDINNAISPVSLLSEMLLDEPDIGDEVKADLRTINTAAVDISHIIERMREFYRERGASETLLPVNLNELVPQVIELTRPRWKDIPQERGIVINIQTDLHPDLPQISGLESEIREAMTNLVFNAADALPEGGVITLRTRFDATSVIFEVCDEGIGMDAETYERCLEPFYSTKGVRGTGLGLAMTFGIMERHEGRIHIESELGEGTTVSLAFPLRQTTDSLAIASDESDAVLKPLSILCIDDEPLLRESIQRMLTRDGHTVELADDGQAGLDAFDAAKARGEPFDVVITDLGMPYLDGRQVVRTIKKISPTTPVILLTGWGTRRGGEGDIPTEADAVLSKPPKVKEVRAALSNIKK
jgi:PAS domain S-box-containing protein